MTRWEYKVVEVPRRDLLEITLALYGKESWELCNSGYEGGAGNSLIFKRPLPPWPTRPGGF